jgi:uncharacterized membrane protein YfcA
VGRWQPAATVVHAYPFSATSAGELALLGLAVGIVGTLIGSGGGFILTPALLIAYPRAKPDLVTAISLVVVFANAAAGSLAYARQRRIDYRSGLQFALAALPGSIAGALIVGVVPRGAFDVIIGALLGGLAIALALGGRRALTEHAAARATPRKLTDSRGVSYAYAVPVRRGIIYSGAVGFVSSFLGIGGGVIHVPLMVTMLGFPTHIATATSHFVLAFMAAAGSITHAIAGTFAGGVGLRRAAALSAGALVGAPLGARLSTRLSGAAIRRVLALGLALIAARVITQAL